MSTRLKYAIPTFILLLSSIAWSDEPVTPLAPSDVVLATPARAPKKGDTYTYTVASKEGSKKKAKTSTLVETLSETGLVYRTKASVSRIERKESDAVLYVQYLPGKTFSMLEVRALTPLRPATDDWKTFPLTRGKIVKLPAREMTVDLGSSKSITTTTGTIQVVGSENLKIGKESLATIKVREVHTSKAKGKGRATTSSITTNYWISPKLGMLAKFTATASNGASFSQTLKSYRLVAKDSTTAER